MVSALFYVSTACCAQPLPILAGRGGWEKESVDRQVGRCGRRTQLDGRKSFASRTSRLSLTTLKRCASLHLRLLHALAVLFSLATLDLYPRARVHKHTHAHTHTQQLQEDRIMELICEHDVLSLLTRNVSAYHTFYSKDTKTHAAKALSGLPPPLLLLRCRPTTARVCLGREVQGLGRQ